MAIRLRKRWGHYVALCAAQSQPEAGDVYLDDGMHNALTSKFAQDFNAEGWSGRGEPIPEDEDHNALREIKLKACPFCGEHPPITPIIEDWGGVSAVHCPRCEANGPATADDQAIAAWNTRKG